MRNGGSQGGWRTTKQKGRSRRHSGVGSYARKNKRDKAERYDRPYLTGNYERVTR